MAYSYDRFDSSTNAGAVLWVGDAGYSGNGMTVSWEGGWHSFAGSWYVSGIYNSIGRDAGAGEVRRDYVDDGSVSGSGDKWFTSYTERFPRYSYNYNVTLYSYVRASVNGATREAQAEYTFTVPATPPTPPTPALVAPTDNSATLSWGYNPSGNIAAVCIERSTDGGSYSEIAVLWSSSATSYTDSSTTAGHVYRYRIRYHHKGAYGDYSYSTWLVNTPPAPTSITTQAIQGSTNINVELNNPATAADGIEWQISDDGGQTWSASTSVPGTPTETPFVDPVTSFVAATNIGGIVRLRVRNYVDDDVDYFSDWLESSDVVTICPPAAPTLTSPVGNVLNMTDGSVTFSWEHNSLDGSAQTAAQLEYSTDGGSTWMTDDLSTEQSHTISPIPWAAGTTVTWTVRTRGAAATGGPDPDYPGGSPWAQSSTFNVYTAPTLSITIDNAVVRDDVLYITGMPVELTATYSDMQDFECKFASVKLMQNGREVYPANLFPNNPKKGTSDNGDLVISGNSITGSLDTSEFLPTNGESYTVVVTARSSSSLQTTANASFLVDFTEPVEGSLQVQNEPETGYVSLLAEYDNTGADEPAVSISVSRVNPDGSLMPLLVEGQSGAGIVDRFAPLNTTYSYAVTTKAASHAVKTVYIENCIKSTRWFVYWGNEIAWAKWNPEGSFSITRPEKRRVHYAGRKWALSYDSKAQDQSHSMSWNVVSREDWENGFYKLMEDGGRGVYKGCDGWVFWADFDFSETPNYTSLTPYSQISLTINRIDGEPL